MECVSYKRKELVLFEGSIKEYVDMILKEKRGNGSVIYLGKIHESIVNELSKKGLILVDTRIIVNQHSITKYFNHPKGKKGAVLPIEEYGLIEKAAKSPDKIYEDASHGGLVYIYSIPYQGKKLLKLVIQPNYYKNGRTYNNIKSWGIVQEANLNNPTQYRLIWEQKTGRKPRF